VSEKEKSQVNIDVQGRVDTHSVIGIANGFSGEFRADGILRIDGDFRGVVKGKGTVLIGEKGRIQGDIYARSVRVGGKIKGNIYAMEKVEILSTGKLVGNLWAPKFLAEEGMVFTGNGKTLLKEDVEKLFKQNVENQVPIINEDI
jgi:cytoskeletal protein CcmA (bactofilin family)